MLRSLCSEAALIVADAPVPAVTLVAIQWYWPASRSLAKVGWAKVRVQSRVALEGMQSVPVALLEGV